MSQHIRSKQFFLKQIAIYERDLYGYLISITDDPQLSEDLLQSSMEKAWEKIEQLREPHKAKGWLFSIAKNEIKLHHRNNEPDFLYIDELDSYEDESDLLKDKSNVLESLVKEFDIENMRIALKLLDSKNRKLIMMHYFQGFNQREIADIMGLKHSTVRVNLVRALRKVRKIRDKIERGKVNDIIKPK